MGARRGWFRLIMVSATAAGVALATPSTTRAEESEPTETAPAAEVSAEPATDPVESGLPVIELVIEEISPAEPMAEPLDTTVQPALDEASGEEHAGGPGEDGHAEGGEEEEHTGGSGGTGDPYRVTFGVSWRSPDDAIIPVLDDTLPGGWQSVFDLAAASATGGGKPTAAHCVYPPGSSQLMCEFENPGKHAEGPDGMVVPAKSTATYSVTVAWPFADWAIDGANAGPYSAWDICPREGGHGGTDSGGSGHGGTDHVEALEVDSPTCVHTVVMRQVEVIVDPPAIEPPASVPPTIEPTPPAEPTPPVVPVVVPAETPPVVSAAGPTPRSLPATGDQASVTLAIGALTALLGAGLLVLARRRSTPPVG